MGITVPLLGRCGTSVGFDRGAVGGSARALADLSWARLKDSSAPSTPLRSEFGHSCNLCRLLPAVFPVSRYSYVFMEVVEGSGGNVILRCFADDPENGSGPCAQFSLLVLSFSVHHIIIEYLLFPVGNQPRRQFCKSFPPLVCCVYSENPHSLTITFNLEFTFWACLGRGFILQWCRSWSSSPECYVCVWSSSRPRLGRAVQPKALLHMSRAASVEG